MPSSSLYDYLEGRFPNPAYTYTNVAEIVEAEERERINKEIGERRTMLGAKIGQVTTDVKREVFESSKLESLYGSIIEWTTDDDLRRLYEEKLLQRAYDTLAVLPLQRKEEKRLQVLKFAQGLVILKHPFAMAWLIVLEWKDVEKIEALDAGLLREYIELFPDDGLSKVLKGYLGSEISPFPMISGTTQPGSDANDDTELMTAADRLLLMTEGLEESSKSVMSQRLMAEYYLYLEEFLSAFETAKRARDLIDLESHLSGFDFQDNLDAVNLILATALIQYQTPRNHPEARALCEAILQRKRANTSALLGVGLILEEEEDYESAIDFLSRALERSPDIKVRTETAWCKAMNGNWEAGKKELEICVPDLIEPDVRTKALKSQTLYRIGVCIWNLDASKAARKDRNGAYAHFLSSLQANLNFAPAYTSLGVYYADYAKDKKRASKCFQKAFELSSSEVEAAERLARAFADQREWDLVEVVAQRVIESGKVRPPPGSKRRGLSWPFTALGVCQLNSTEYHKSIVSFQAALRVAPEEYHSWVGLGESYHNSGRYIAATKAFEQAQKLEICANIDIGDAWFSRYMLANVRRELGDFDEAAIGYEEVLQAKPAEFGVSISLLQAHVESAWRSIELGFFGRAASSAAKAVTVAGNIAKYRIDAFNLWKAMGDACSALSWMQNYVGKFPLRDVLLILQCDTVPEMFEKLVDLDHTGAEALQALGSGDSGYGSLEDCLRTAILTQKRLIYVSLHDIHAQAVAWYNLGWTEYRAHVVLAQNINDGLGKEAPQYLKASVRCFKRAIELEAGNSDFWNALAVVTTKLNPRVAQHSFVRSLYLNDKSAKVWTNLGTLYLLQQDSQLANDAFARAQSADPECTHAWVGQGILALLLGEIEEAQSLFTHAFEIADSSSIITKQLYASSTFDHLLTQTSENPATDILQPLFALEQLRSQITADTVFGHLQALFLQRVSATLEAIERLESVCEGVEAEYELSESPLSLARFAQAKADLARAYLADENFTTAAETAEISLDLSSDHETSWPDLEARRKHRLSAHLTAGLAYYYSQKMDLAIAMFRTALEETDGSPDAVCVLAQVLWAKGGVEERNVARDQLFYCAEKHPSHASTIMLLAVITMLDNDQDTLEAVAADLHDLRTRSDIDWQQQSRIGHLLAALATSTATSENRNSAEIAKAQATVMLAPSKPYGWSQLAELSEETYPTEMALLTAKGAVPPKGPLNAEDLSKAFAGTARPADAQRAIMVAPWLTDGWERLA